MDKSPRSAMMIHLAKWVDECGLTGEDPEPYIPFLRALQNLDDIYMIEGLLKATITLMKRHKDKLNDVSDTDIRVVFQTDPEVLSRTS